MQTYTWACINTYTDQKTQKTWWASQIIMPAQLEDLWKLQGYSVIAAKVGRNLLLSHNSDRKEPIKHVRSKPPVWKADLVHTESEILAAVQSVTQCYANVELTGSTYSTWLLLRLTETPVDIGFQLGFQLTSVPVYLFWLLDTSDNGFFVFSFCGFAFLGMMLLLALR